MNQRYFSRKFFHLLFELFPLVLDFPGSKIDLHPKLVALAQAGAMADLSWSDYNRWPLAADAAEWRHCAIGAGEDPAGRSDATAGAPELRTRAR